MKEQGITGVLSLLGCKELDQERYNTKEMQDILRNNGIKCYKNLQIDDTNLESYEEADKIYEATQYLNDMLENKGCQVLIHSASGHTRATTLLIAYLHVFQKHPDWEDL